MEPLWKALDLSPGERLALVGSGGKTTLLFELGLEARREGRGALLTTTTRMWLPEPIWPLVSLEELPCAWSPGRQLFLAGPVDKGKVTGLTPQELDGVDLKGMDLMVVEADGSRGLPVKAHAEHEPVLPERTSLVVAVLGMSGLGRPAGVAHRSEQLCALLGCEPQDPLREHQLVRVVQGYLERSPAPRQVVVLNQADTAPLQEAAQRIALSLPCATLVRGRP